MLKTCSNINCPCVNPQPIDNFYKHPNCIDGHLGQCKTCRKQYSKFYYADNRDRFISKAENWIKNNRNKHNGSVSKYGKNNREKTRESCNRRRALKKQLPSTLTTNEWQEILVKFNNSCAYCGVQQSELDHKLHQEHVVPLSKGGGYTKENIVPACRSCNLKKGAKLLNDKI